MESIGRFITRRLKLKVNRSKSAVTTPQKRKFLGFSFTGGKSPTRRRIAPQSIEQFRKRVRQMTNRNLGISLEERIRRLSEYLNGWINYFGYCQTPSVLKELDGWIRRRLRSVLWKQWKVF